jgi:ornithine cyclodeaminase/alanine dehydrogenase-like protein (mu-crystallin family)
MKDKLQAEIVAVATAEEAVRDAEIVICATNSSTPVLQASWLAVHAHVSQY